MPEPPRCAFPRCPVPGRHEHHITYDPEVTKYLCIRHHEEITIINGQQARKYRRSLSNQHRWWIWYQWIEGKLKGRRTQKALEYTGEWGVSSPPKMEVVIFDEPSAPEQVTTTPVKRKRKRHGKQKKQGTKPESKRRKRQKKAVR